MNRLGPIVWIEGIPAAGKTTLVDAVAKALNLRAMFEPVESNPYLDDFYKDPKRWAFPMQMDMLGERYKMQKLAAYEATTIGGYKGAVLDRGMAGDRIFASLHSLYGNITEREWLTYQNYYNFMTCSLIPPSILIYLDIEPKIALERMHKREREAEKDVPLKYMQDLRKGYLDLLVQIESGQHAWSRGMEIKRVPWNVDHQSPKEIIHLLAHKYELEIDESWKE